MTTQDKPKVLTEDELRALCNETTPQEAFVLVLSFMQRITIALERLATSPDLPNPLFEQKTPHTPMI